MAHTQDYQVPTRDFTSNFSSMFMPTPQDLHAIGEADARLLTETRNYAYKQLGEQLAFAQSELFTVKLELASEKKHTEQLLHHIPQLIMPSGWTPPLPESGNEPKLGLYRMRPLLGTGLPWPQSMERSQCGNIKFFYYKEYTAAKEEIKAQGGSHSRGDNVGQMFMEPKSGETVDGFRAASARDLVFSCFHSLLLDGQLVNAHNFRAIPETAKVWLYFILGTEFPELRLCNDGRWKMDELMKEPFKDFTQKYDGVGSGAVLKRRSTATSGASHSKRARTADSMLEGLEAMDPKPEDEEEANVGPSAGPATQPASQEERAQPLNSDDAMQVDVVIPPISYATDRVGARSGPMSPAGAADAETPVPTPRTDEVIMRTHPVALNASLLPQLVGQALDGTSTSPTGPVRDDTAPTGTDLPRRETDSTTHLIGDVVGTLRDSTPQETSGPSDHALPITIRPPRRAPVPVPSTTASINGAPPVGSAPGNDESNGGAPPAVGVTSAASTTKGRNGRVAIARLADGWQRKQSEKNAFEELLLHTNPDVLKVAAGNQWKDASREEKQRAQIFMKRRPATPCTPGTSCGCLAMLESTVE